MKKLNITKKRENELESRIGELDVELIKLIEEKNRIQRELDTEKSSRAEAEALQEMRSQKAVRDAAHGERAKGNAEMARQLELLRRQITERLQKEHTAELDEIRRQKMDEMAATRRGWQEALDKMAAQNAQYKALLEEGQNGKMKELKQLRDQLDEAESTHERAIGALQLDFQKQKALVRAELMSAHRQREEEWQREHREQLDLHEQQHREDSMKMMEAQRISIKALKSKLEINQQNQIRHMEQQHNNAVDLLQMRIEEKHQSELNEEARRHEDELLDIENQLEEEKLKSQQIECALEDKITELRTQLADSSAHVDTIQKEKQEYADELANYRLKIQTQNQTFEKVITEKREEMRTLAEKYEIEKESALNAAEVDHVQKVQNMVIEFNHAQELLKGKINDVTSERDELEKRYVERGSRPEDLDKIANLKNAVKEREVQLAKMEEEMKYFQLELVNREQNYNALFSSSPNVGLLNPLGSSSSTSSGRKNVRMNQIPRQARFSEQFVKIEPGIYSEPIPPPRLEPLQPKQRTVR